MQKKMIFRLFFRFLYTLNPLACGKPIWSNAHMRPQRLAVRETTRFRQTLPQTIRCLSAVTWRRWPRLQQPACPPGCDVTDLQGASNQAAPYVECPPSEPQVTWVRETPCRQIACAPYAQCPRQPPDRRHRAPAGPLPPQRGARWQSNRLAQGRRPRPQACP